MIAVRQMDKRVHGRCFAVFASYLVYLAGSCCATEWPQFRGPTHDGASTDRIATQWTGNMTNPIWQGLLPNCLGSLTVSKGRAFTQAVRSLAAPGKEVSG